MNGNGQQRSPPLSPRQWLSNKPETAFQQYSPAALEAKEQLQSQKLFDVSHVTAVVTGGGSGIGLMITQALVANGARVYVVERRKLALLAVVSTYNTGPGQIIPLLGDISRKEEVEEIVKKVAEQEPNGIQLLVNNAGICLDSTTEFETNGQPDLKDPVAISSHFMKADPTSWSDMFATNVTGQFFMCMAFLPLLAKGCDVVPGYSSSVINITGNAGFLKGTTRGHIGYAASKAALIHLTRMLATTFAQTRVRVNSIAPGVFPSEMTTGESNQDQKSTFKGEVSNLSGRPGKETDMAATILFLAGRGGVFYNDQFLFPDGGETLMEPAAI